MVWGAGVQVEKVMKALHVRKLYLWPRFQAQVKADLEARPPEVREGGAGGSMWECRWQGVSARGQADAMQMAWYLVSRRVGRRETHSTSRSHAPPPYTHTHTHTAPSAALCYWATSSAALRHAAPAAPCRSWWSSRWA